MEERKKCNILLKYRAVYIPLYIFLGYYIKILTKQQQERRFLNVELFKTRSENYKSITKYQL